MRQKLRIVAVNLAFLLLGALLIEVGALVMRVRPGAIDPSLGFGARGGREVVARYYFTANDERGFDIAKSAKPSRFSFNEGTYEIWSNKYGCLDRNESFDGDYALLLGDSFTWGYAPHEAKWGTRLEQSLRFPIAKCGVGHTGQRHQLSKGRDVVAAIGHAPKLVIVGYFWNDPHDDYIYPEATVIDGWLINMAFIEKGVIARRTRAELETRIHDRLAQLKAGEHGLMPWIRKRSVILAGMNRLTKGGSKGRDERFGVGDTEEFESVDPAPNRAAIEAIKAWTESIGARLFFVLIPRRDMDKDYYAALRPFLDARKIEYLDLYAPTYALPDHGKSLYWRYDPHWNPEGDRFAAEILDGELKRRFGALLTPSATPSATPAAPSTPAGR